MKDIVEIVECSVEDIDPEADEITRPANEIWPGWIPVAQDAGQKAAGTRSWIRPVPRVEPSEDTPIFRAESVHGDATIIVALGPEAEALVRKHIERAKAADDAEAA